jgi:hypothetical protein
VLNKLTLKIDGNSYIEGSTIEVEDLAILVGYNATLKSIIARTFLHCEEKGGVAEFSTLRDLNISYVIDPADLPCNSLKGYIPDARIMLRELYSSYERILELVKHLDSIAERVRRPGKETPIDESEIENVKSMFQEIISRLGLKMVTDVVEFKKRAGSWLLERVRRIYEDVLNDLARKLRDDYEEEVASEEIAPLEVLEIEEGEGLPALRVYDKRFRNEVRHSLLSSSIVAPLLIEYIISFMSLPPAKESKSRILVIEEPEEALTPLQQVLIMRFLYRALKEMDELIKAKTFVIVTTDSPYVAFAADAKLYFLRFDRKSNRITISEDKPHTPFVLADLLLGARGT